MITPDLELTKLVEKKLIELKQIVDTKWGKFSAPTVFVNYDLNSSRSLGMCQTNKNFEEDSYTIRLNPELLNEYREEYINEVFVHEYAHAITSHFFHPSKANRWKKIMPHGKEFKSVCSLFGIIGKSTSNLTKGKGIPGKQKNRQKRWSYSCDCGHNHQVSTTIHNKMSKGQKRICALCRSQLFKV